MYDFLASPDAIQPNPDSPPEPRVEKRGRKRKQPMPQRSGSVGVEDDDEQTNDEAGPTSSLFWNVVIRDTGPSGTEPQAAGNDSAVDEDGAESVDGNDTFPWTSDLSFFSSRKTGSISFFFTAGSSESSDAEDGDSEVGGSERSPSWSPAGNPGMKTDGGDPWSRKPAPWSRKTDPWSRVAEDHSQYSVTGTHTPCLTSCLGCLAENGAKN